MLTKGSMSIMGLLMCLVLFSCPLLSFPSSTFITTSAHSDARDGYSNPLQTPPDTLLVSPGSSQIPFHSYRVPESAIIDQSPLRAYRRQRMYRPGSFRKLLNPLKNTAKRAVGIKRSPGNIKLNATEIEMVGCYPTLMFVNRKSGGKVGEKLITTLRSILNDIQVCDVTESNPSQYLELFATCKKNMQIICCGGDGTISWVTQELKRWGMEDVPVGVIPFGTGNDLYRVLADVGNNPSWDCLSIPDVRNPSTFFEQFARPKKDSNLDQWLIDCDAIDEDEDDDIESSLDHTKLIGRDTTGISLVHSVKTTAKRILPFLNRTLYPSKTINNYFGIGVDGHVSLMFDDMRKTYPRLFFNKWINKFLYMLMGLWYIFFSKPIDLSQAIEMECDGKPISIPQGAQGIVLLNINSYAGGSHLWKFAGQKKSITSTDKGTWRATQMNDQMFEVITVSGAVHIAKIKAGISNAVPLAQGSTLCLKVKQKVHMQVDGEAWTQRPCLMSINWAGRVRFMPPKPPKRMRVRQKSDNDDFFLSIEERNMGEVVFNA